VTAEEQGLLGSQYYAGNPIVPLSKTLANINMDGLNVHGRTQDVTVIDYGASDLDDYVRIAAEEQGSVIRPDPEPEKGFYYRSKHEADYTREYVPLAGLFFLKDGPNSAGSAASSDVRLPSRAPASIGRFVYQNQHVRFEPQAGSPVTLKGQTVTKPIDLRSDE